MLNKEIYRIGPIFLLAIGHLGVKYHPGHYISSSKLVCGYVNFFRKIPNTVISQT